jgi:hypothetical protein
VDAKTLHLWLLSLYRRDDMSEWRSIETAPKDGTKIDLFAKIWRCHSDTFAWTRFTDCYWTREDNMVNCQSHWVGLGKGWNATHWMPLPDPPALSLGETTTEQENHPRVVEPK